MPPSGTRSESVRGAPSTRGCTVTHAAPPWIRAPAARSATGAAPAGRAPPGTSASRYPRTNTLSAKRRWVSSIRASSASVYAGELPMSAIAGRYWRTTIWGALGGSGANVGDMCAPPISRGVISARTIRSVKRNPSAPFLNMFIPDSAASAVTPATTHSARREKARPRTTSAAISSVNRPPAYR